MDKEATKDSSTQLLNLPLLPKNCVALVGNTPVCLGQQLFLMDSNKNASDDVSKTQTNVTKPYTQKARKSIRGTTASRPIEISDDKTQTGVSQSSSVSPGYAASYLMKALSSSTSMNKSLETEKSMTYTNTSGAHTNTSDQTSPLQKFHLPRNYTISLLKNNESRPELTLTSQSQNGQPKDNIQKHKSISAALLSSQPGIVSLPSKALSMKNKPVDVPHFHLIEEHLQSTPKEKPSGSITVNLHGQAVKIVGLPANYMQSAFLQKPQRETETTKGQSKSSQPHSTYDKKIKALKEANLLLKRSSSNATNRFRMAVPGSTAILSQLPPSTSNGQSKSMIIGNIASLTTQPSSQILNTAQLVRAPACGVISQGNIATVPRSSQSIIIPVTLAVPRGTTPIITPSSEPYSTLKTFLKSSAVPATSYVHSLLQSSVSSSQQYSSNIAISENKFPSSIKIIDSNPSTTQDSTSQDLQYYTSLETFQEGNSVMVMKPILDSSDDEYNSTNTSSQISMTDDLHANSNVHNTKATQKQISVLNSDPQTVLKRTVDARENKSTFNPKIKSVFSLATTSSEFDDAEPTNNTNMEVNEVDDDIEIIDVDDEEETQFNIHDKSWKEKCPPSNVVLERLDSQNIEDIETGKKCSPHCRLRTLAYLCDLNLMPCENRPIVIDNSGEREPDHPSNIVIDVDNPYENNKQEQQTELTSSDNDIVKKPDDLNKECGKEPDSGPQAVTNDTNGKLESNPQHVKKPDDLNKERGKEPDSGPQAITNDTNGKLESNPQQSEKETRSSARVNAPRPVSDAEGDKQKPAVSHTDVYSKANEKEESTQLKRDLISLKRLVAEKRQEMQKQKKEHRAHSKPQSISINNKTEVSGVLKASSKQSTSTSTAKKLPVVLGSVLKSGTANLHQANPLNSRFKTASNVNKQSIMPRPSSSSGNKNSLIAPIYVTDCSASTLFGKSKSQQTTSTSSISSGTTSLITTVPLHSTNSSVPNKSGAKVPLSKVYAALKSLSAQVKSTGQKLNGTQFVMIENNKTSVLLKVRHEALLPENLNALHKAVIASAPSKEKLPGPPSQSETCKSSTSTPTSVKSNLVSSATAVHRSLANTFSSPSTTTTGLKTVSSTSVINLKSSTTARISQSLQDKLKQKSLSMSTSSNLANILKRPSCSSGILSTSVGGRNVSLLLASNQSASQPSRSFFRPTQSVSNAYNDTRSTLTHVPSNSTLLPERKKRPQGTMSAEQRAAKRRRLEEKYPLPPGVVIKSEPDTSEYDIDNNWLVTSEIHTGFINSSEIAETRVSENMNDRTRDNPTNVLPQSDKQPSENVDTDSVVMAEEDTEYDSPPPLTVLSTPTATMEKGSEDCPEVIEDDDAPPVLQPMPSLTFRSMRLVTNDSSSPTGVFTGPRRRKSTKALQEAQTKVYDSGYDTAVSASSSAESLALGQPVQSAKSKIQQLKELLKQKELQVENMRKKRQQMPEVDLNSL